MRVLSVASAYSSQPEEKVITISRIKDASCPYRYFKSYVEEPRQEKPFEAIEAGMGQFFHSYLEEHFRLVMARCEPVARTDSINVEDVVRKFRLGFIWEGSVRRPYRIVTHQYALEDFIDRLERVADNWNAFLTGSMVGHTVVAVEGQLQLRADGLYIRGKHDLITATQDGELVLWDWKTGRAPLPHYFTDFEAQKVQLGIYATWMQYRFNRHDVRGKAVFLRDGVEIQSETFGPEVEHDVLQYCAEWRRKLNGWSSYPSVPGTLCDWCGWNPTCSAYQQRGPRLVLSRAEGAERLGATGREEIRRKLGETGLTPSGAPASKCFVATAVFEGADAEEVRTLRHFRDTVLAGSAAGRILISVYGVLGPIAARLITAAPCLRRLARRVLARLAAEIQARAKYLYNCAKAMRDKLEKIEKVVK